MAESGIAMRKVLQGPTRETPAVVQELSEESFRDPHPAKAKFSLLDNETCYSF
jgi:hypothetical protein